MGQKGNASCCFWRSVVAPLVGFMNLRSAINYFVSVSVMNTAIPVEDPV